MVEVIPEGVIDRWTIAGYSSKRNANMESIDRHHHCGEMEDDGWHNNDRFHEHIGPSDGERDHWMHVVQDQQGRIHNVLWWCWGALWSVHIQMAQSTRGSICPHCLHSSGICLTHSVNISMQVLKQRQRWRTNLHGCCFSPCRTRRAYSILQRLQHVRYDLCIFYY